MSQAAAGSHSAASLRGALWMGGAVLSFSAMAIAARELLRHMGAFEVVLARSVVMLLIALALVPGNGGLRALSTGRFGLHLLRNSSHFVGQSSWVYAISALPLATVFAIEFTMPVWTALLAALMLGERLTPRKVAMLALGLAGVLIILRPGMSVVHPAALVMLLGSLGFAVQFIWTKQLVSTESTLKIIFWMAVIQLPMSLVGSLPSWVWPVWADLPWIVAVGVGSYTAHHCITRAMRLADASVVVPVDFLRLPLIAVVGAMAYGEPLDPLVFVGAGLIFVGTYVALARRA